MSDRRKAERRDDTRTLPHSLDAERSVIGALLIENKGFDLVSSYLAPKMFFREAHRKIYAACVAVLTAGQPLDLVSLKVELERRDELEDVGGYAYVASLIDGVPRSTNIRYYADVVREHAIGVGLIKFGQKVIERGYSATQPVRSQLHTAEAEIAALATGAGIESGAVSLADDAGALYREIERRIERRGQLLGVSSGYGNIDLITHGLQKRKMIVVAGRTHMGKSVLALELAKAAAKSGAGWVVYYSLEMERQELQFRLLSGLSGIPLELINWGNIQSGAYGKLTNAWEELAQLPILINDTPSITVDDQRAELKRIKAERGLVGFVTDHVQLVDGEGENRTQQLTEISRRTKKLTGELDCFGIVVSQLNRGDKDLMREPQPHDLRECGALEQDADVLIMLHPYDPRAAMAMPPPSIIPMKILFRKNRGGEMGVCCLDLERELVRFVEAEPPKPIPKAEPAEAKKGRVKSPTMW